MSLSLISLSTHGWQLSEPHDYICLYLIDLIDQEHLDESKQYRATYSHWTYLVELVYLSLVLLWILNVLADS